MPDVLALNKFPAQIATKLTQPIHVLMIEVDHQPSPRFQMALERFERLQLVPGREHELKGMTEYDFPIPVRYRDVIQFGDPLFRSLHGYIVLTNRLGFPFNAYLTRHGFG